MSLEDGGSLNPFDSAALSVKMSSVEDWEYTCGGCLHWVNAFYSPVKVPILSAAIRLLMASSFRKPSPGHQITVMVNSDSAPRLLIPINQVRAVVEPLTSALSDCKDPRDDTSRASSLLKRLSREEFHHAMILATARDIELGINVTEATLALSVNNLWHFGACVEGL